MDTNTQRDSCPPTVILALIVLLASFAASLVPRLLRTDWDGFLVYIKFGVEFIILFLPLWFVLRGKSWARWLLVAFAFGGFCLSLPLLIKRVEAHSTTWIATYCFRNGIILVALIALFLPASSQWFRGGGRAMAPSDEG